ncbi:MAG: lytic transglycosylase domain-containing protein [Candidatus Pacearchaeota archaeon]|nr:lytic transglycosylase domain-containing protein [Candidatus Pacearchaeota archaeon]
MKKYGLPLTLAFVLAGARNAYSAQLNRQEVDNVVANALAAQRNNHTEVTPDFVRGVILAESEGNPRARSRAGALGLMQIMPRTWNQLTGNANLDQAYDTQTNANAGVTYLNQLATYGARNHPNWNNMNTRQRQDAIAAMYNGGMGHFRNHNWELGRMNQETRNYVPRVRARARSNP